MKKPDLDLYSDYLLSSFGSATATGLSAMVEGDVSHDQITRFLSAQDYTSKHLWQQVKSGGVGGGVTPAQAVQLINKQKAQVIDVCEPAEFAAAHVTGAKNIPLGQLGEGKGLPSNKAIPLVVVCATGGSHTDRHISVLH